VLDAAAQKGTGKWTSQDSFNIGAPMPTINTAVVERIISSMKEERVAASAMLPGPQDAYSGDRQALIDAVRQALYASKISAYAQGMAMLRIASRDYGYSLNLGEVASIWRGGCIIRARFLNRITDAFTRNPELANLLLDEDFAQAVRERFQTPRLRPVLDFAEVWFRERETITRLQQRRILAAARGCYSSSSRSVCPAASFCCTCGGTWAWRANSMLKLPWPPVIDLRREA